MAQFLAFLGIVIVVIVTLGTGACAHDTEHAAPWAAGRSITAAGIAAGQAVWTLATSVVGWRR